MDIFIVSDLRNKVTLYTGEPVKRLKKSSITDFSISKLVNGAVSKYQDIIKNNQHNLASEEIDLLKSVYQPGSSNTLPIDEACNQLVKKGTQDGLALAEKLATMPLVQKYSVIEEMESVEKGQRKL